MKQSAECKRQEKEFLSLCCQHDKDLLNEKVKMTRSEFERITHITMALGFVAYTQVLLQRYMNFTVSLTEQMDREAEFIEEYPSYYLDEEIYEKHDKWIDDFCNYLPVEKQELYREKIKRNNEFI